MKALLLRWATNALALFIAVQLVPGLSFTGGLGKLAGVALVFGVINALLRPLLTLLSCPLILLTFGLFVFVINAVLLQLTAWVSDTLGLGFTVDGFGSAFVGSLLIGIVSVLVSIVVKDETDQPRPR